MTNCAWCGTEGSAICPDCADRMKAARKRLESAGEFSREALREEMKKETR